MERCRIHDRCGQAAVPLPSPKRVPDNIDYKSNIYVTNENRHDTPDPDHSSSNKKLDKNKITTDIPPPFHFHDLLPEYKIYLYWEVKAG